MPPEIVKKVEEILHRKYLCIVQERLVAVECLHRLHNKHILWYLFKCMNNSFNTEQTVRLPLIFKLDQKEPVHRSLQEGGRQTAHVFTYSIKIQIYSIINTRLKF